MADLLAIAFFSSPIVMLIFAFRSSHLYLSATKGISEHTVLAKLRRLVRLLPWVTLISMLILSASFALYWITGIKVPGSIEVGVIAAALSLPLLLIALLLTLFSDYARPHILGSFEVRLMALSFIALKGLAHFGWKVLKVILKASARSSSSKNGSGGGRRGEGYHGYLSYEERAMKDRGDWY